MDVAARSELDFVASSRQSAVAFAGARVRPYVDGLPSWYTTGDGWVTWHEMTPPTGWTTFLDAPPQVLPDGTWFALAEAAPRHLSGPGVIGEPELDMITSRDGVNWQLVSGVQSPRYAAVLGSSLFASAGVVEESQDGGATWLKMRDASGAEVAGLYTVELGGHVLVFDGELNFPNHLLWIGTPIRS